MRQGPNARPGLARAVAAENSEVKGRSAYCGSLLHCYGKAWTPFRKPKQQVIAIQA